MQPSILDNLWINYFDTKDEKAKKDLIENYVPLVKHVISRMNIAPPSYLDYEDLVSYGIFGLIQAIERYDVTKKVKFETYAYMRIRGSIIDELRKVDGVPQSIKNNAKTLQEAFSYLEQTLGRTVEDEDLCKYLNITSDELNNLYKSIAPLTTTIPFDDFILPDDTYFLENPMDVLIEKKETCKILGEAIAELPKKEKTVITLYYYEDLNFKEISKVLDLSQGRISQLHTKAILRLRGKLSRRLKFP